MEIHYIRSKQELTQWLKDREKDIYRVNETAKSTIIDFINKEQKECFPKKYRSKKRFAKLIYSIDEIQRDCKILSRKIELCHNSFNEEFSIQLKNALVFYDMHKSYLKKWNIVAKEVESVYNYLNKS